MMGFSIRFSVLFTGVLSLITCGSVVADETSSTIVNPATQETTTTTVNPATQQTTVTQTNPNTQTTTTTIITPAPSPKETVPIPEGYANCFKVASGWFSDIWIPEHNVCQYQNGTEGVAWVEGYWACTKYTTETCTNWDWKKAHWVKTLEVY